MNNDQAITYLLGIFRSFLNGEPVLHLDPSIINSLENYQTKELFELINTSLSRYISGSIAVKSMAEGNLNFSIPDNNKVLMSVEILHSKLKHLIWQTQQIAQGDYSQHIDFIGDFSAAFNQLIESLKHRKELENQLEENQRKYQLITDNTIDVIWIIDIATKKYTFISPSVYKLRGLTVEEAMCESIEESILAESSDQILERFNKLQFLINNNYPLPESYDEYQQRCKNGEIIDIEVSTNLIYNSEGKPIELLGISRDITKRKKTELALKESEEKYRFLTENTIDVIWKLDVNTQEFTFISPSIERMTGYHSSEIKSLINPELFVPSSYKRIVQILDEVKNHHGNSPIQIFERLQSQTKSGNIIDIEVTANIIYNSQGIPVELVGVSRNITERIITEKALKENEEKYRLITENTSDIIWKIDIGKLCFSYISPSNTRVTGFHPDESINRPLSEILPTETYHKMVSILNQRLNAPSEQESNFCERFEVKRKQGGTLTVEANASFIRDQNGSPVEVIGVSRDISERIEIENALRESESKLTKLLTKQSTKNKELINQLQYIYNNANNSIAFFDIEGDQIYFSSCNKRWANAIGYNPEELKGLNLDLLSDKETSFLYRKYVQKVVELRQPIEDYIYWHNLHLHVIVIPIIDEQTESIHSCGSLVYNISEKYEVEAKMRETEQRFSSIFNNTKDAIVLLNMKLEIMEVNESFLLLHGNNNYPKDNTLKNYFPEEYHKTIQGFIQSVSNGLSIPTYECEVYKHDRTRIPVEISTSAITLNQQPMILCIIRDISMKKEMEKEISTVSRQIETRERRKLAADLHDNVGPLLSSMNMYLSVLSRKNELLPYSEIMSDIKRILKDTISTVREISNNLSPMVLQNFGLTAALDQFFETKTKLININLENNIGDKRFPEIIEIMVYNIILEVFNNTIKHSEANRVNLSIKLINNALEITYSDNGKGFYLEEKMNKAHTNLGLFSIIDRVKIIDGTYLIDTAPSKGFMLKISCPLKNINHE